MFWNPDWCLKEGVPSIDKKHPESGRALLKQVVIGVQEGKLLLQYLGHKRCTSIWGSRWNWQGCKMGEHMAAARQSTYQSRRLSALPRGVIVQWIRHFSVYFTQNFLADHHAGCRVFCLSSRLTLSLLITVSIILISCEIWDQHTKSQPLTTLLVIHARHIRWHPWYGPGSPHPTSL